MDKLHKLGLYAKAAGSPQCTKGSTFVSSDGVSYQLLPSYNEKTWMALDARTLETENEQRHTPVWPSNQKNSCAIDAIVSLCNMAKIGVCQADSLSFQQWADLSPIQVAFRLLFMSYVDKPLEKVSLQHQIRELMNLVDNLGEIPQYEVGKMVDCGDIAAMLLEGMRSLSCTMGTRSLSCTMGTRVTCCANGKYDRGWYCATGVTKLQ